MLAKPIDRVGTCRESRETAIRPQRRGSQGSELRQAAGGTLIEVVFLDEGRVAAVAATASNRPDYRIRQRCDVLGLMRPAASDGLHGVHKARKQTGGMFADRRVWIRQSLIQRGIRDRPAFRLQRTAKKLVGEHR